MNVAPILQVENLSHIYSVGTPFEHVALDCMNFSVERGEFIGIIGHTGSGKSTLMQHLNGLLKPTSGRVLLDGKDIWSDKKTTRPLRFILHVYKRYFDIMQNRGWEIMSPKPVIETKDKLAIAYTVFFDK